MNSTVIALMVAYVATTVWRVSAGGDEGSNAVHTARQDGAAQGSSWAAAPEWYRKEALRLLLREASQVASNLNLAEKIPIVEADLAMAFVPPPGIASQLRSLGVVETRDYSYSVPKDNKLCYVSRKRQDELLRRLREEYSWPIRLVDTNAAYQLAAHWLEAFPVDLAALNRDYKVEIALAGLRGHGAKRRFTPVYWISWPARPKGSGCVAEVCLFLPSKTLIDLSVQYPEYVLRSPVAVTNHVPRESLAPERKFEGPATGRP